MRATDFEFRYRFWVIMAIFLAALGCYAFDPVNAGVALARLLLGGQYDLHAAHHRFVIHAVFAFSAALVAAAAALRTWATAYLKSEVVHDLDLHREALVTDGPYRYTRNPLYFGGLLLSAGLGLLLSRTGWFVLMIPLTLYLFRLTVREEGELLKTQGESYVAYCARVSRFWPALEPRVAKSGMQPRWKQALAGEMFFWACAVATAFFAATFNLWVTIGIPVAARVAQAVHVFGFRRHAPNAPH